MDSMDKVLERIRKLLALANDNRADTQEAAVAAGMAAKMMAKYQVDAADVIIAELGSVDCLDEVIMQPRMGEWDDRQTRIPKWCKIMGGTIAELTDTRCLTSWATLPNGRNESVIKFQGYKADAKFAEYLMNFVVSTLRRLRADFKKSFTYRTKGISTLRNYTNGIVVGLQRVLDSELAIIKPPSSCTDLVVAKRRAIIDKFGNFAAGARVEIDPSSDEFIRGVVDGEAVKLLRPIETNKEDVTLLGE